MKKQRNIHKDKIGFMSTGKGKAVVVEPTKQIAPESRLHQAGDHVAEWLRFPRYLYLSAVVFIFAAIVGGAYLYVDANTYPSGPMEPEAFFSPTAAFEITLVPSENTGYALPLSVLPENYDTVKTAIPEGISHEQMILLMRNGFVTLEAGEGQVPDIYRFLAEKNIPLIVTADSVLVYSRNIREQKRQLLEQELLIPRLARFLLAVAFEQDGISGDRAVAEGNSVILSVAWCMLNATCPISDRVAEEVVNEKQAYVDSLGYEVNDRLRLRAALQWLDESYQDNSDESARQQMVLAQTVKRSPRLLSEWQLLQGYVGFFYPEYDVLPLGEIDRAIGQAGGYGFRGRPLLDDEMVEAVQRYRTTHAKAEVDSDEFYDGSIELAASMGVQRACGLLEIPTEVEIPTEACVDEYAVIGASSVTSDAVDRWTADALLPQTVGTNLAWAATEAWESKSILSAIAYGWRSNTVVQNTEENAETNERQESAKVADSVVYLEPNPALYRRLAYIADAYAKGFERLGGRGGLVSSMTDLSSIMHRLSEISEIELAGTALDASDRAVLSSLVDDLMATDQTSLVSDTAVILQAIPSEGASTTLAAGGVLVFQEPPESADAADASDDHAEGAANIPDWLQPKVGSDNFNEPYDYPLAQQAAGTVRIPVLMYHHIAVSPTQGSARRFYVSPEVFEQQLAYLAVNNYQTLTPYEYYQALKLGKNPDQKSIVLTFDDAPYDNYTTAFPLLKKYGFVGVFFVSSHRSGIPASALMEMANAGMVIDSHGETHKDLKTAKSALEWTEIAGSKAALQSMTGKTVYSIAYPGCVIDSEGYGMVAESGYLLGFSCGSSIDNSYYHRLSLSRMHVYNNVSHFKKILSGIFVIPKEY